MSRRIEHACVATEIDDEGIAWVTFNRPEKRNAMSPQLHYDMEAVMMEIETDEAVKVTVLTGAGDSWSAGMDLREYFRETDNDPAAQFRSFTANKHWSWEILSMSRKPTVAMVNGYCFGARSFRCAPATSWLRRKTRCSACPRSIGGSCRAASSAR